ALPIGIYSAVRQYSPGDYFATFIGFIGLAVPNFLLALVLLYFGFVFFNAHIGGLFSPELQDAPWSMARAWDLAKHLPIPALTLGPAGPAQVLLLGVMTVIGTLISDIALVWIDPRIRLEET